MFPFSTYEGPRTISMKNWCSGDLSLRSPGQDRQEKYRREVCIDKRDKHRGDRRHSSRFIRASLQLYVAVPGTWYVFYMNSTGTTLYQCMISTSIILDLCNTCIIEVDIIF